MVIKRIGGGKQRGACCCSQLGQLAKSTLFIAAVGEGGGKITTTGRSLCKCRQAIGQVRREALGRNNDKDLAVAFGQQVLERKVTFAFQGAPIAAREQSAKPTVGRA